MTSYLNTDPDLDEYESILREYPADVFLVERDHPEEGRSFRFHAPVREAVTFADEDRARLFADLYTAVDGFRIGGVGEGGIPVNVAVAGTAEIAAYMYAAWGQTPTQIAQTLDSNRQNVLEYFERVNDRAEKVIAEG
ncbi:hypothetical protein RH858_02945 [Halalkaliarchaeum sp. AArc-GB]|uniref:hypothetical protein n=1 Tax=Halalkaliarchaeum sp. AArc-GB TaxID=3074078 RepID=UPI0028585E3E|nr:hypothetical protein [Halalkaliarchaeum sp. AArc-GB]MDR5672112.1 hypothetical protein [Halalkaliarchaeum sp. AArc-GB]